MTLKTLLLTALPLAVLSLSQNVGATPLPPDFCKKWEDMPIRQRGRVKPLYVHAVQSIKYLTGKTKSQGMGPLELYCRLSLAFPLGQTPPPLKAPIEHIKLQKLLGLEGKGPWPYPLLLEKEAQVRSARRQEEKNPGPYGKAMDRLLGQIALYQDILQGQNWTLPTEGNWAPIAALAQGLERPLSSHALSELLEKTKADYLDAHGQGHLVELYYVKSRIHSISMGLILLSLFLLILIRRPLPGLLFAGLSLLVQVASVVWRIMISGRAPITNMYETVLFSGLAALTIALVIGHLRREKSYVIAGLSYNFLCSLMINFADGMLSGDISPLVPVLRDNFWLSTHVTTVILSYAAFAISWILANTALLKRRFSSMTPKEFRHQADSIYTCLKVGVVLLAAGVILGGIWADYSWGRFWGWDPKETWSAIALCIYLAILHGRYTHWISDSRFVPAVAAAFMSIMMAWFGVNYILAVGLHSYGFSEGGAVFLMSIFTVQALILGVTLTRLKTD
ncbi:MAG: cytochrome c biogenesis protein CcsA [Bacteriovoracales bacterium]|nr:cytochrome c biogenesis protein CcsA [Bacteriovoracales bacterium]